MGFGDFVGDVVDGGQNVVGGVVDGAQQFASDPIGTVAGVFGGGDPSGTDGGSSNWAAWGHEEIRSMLDNTVEPADIDEGARAWGDLQTQAGDLITSSTADLRNIVSNGWRGESAEAAIRSLAPVDEWANTLSAAMHNTAQLMGNSGSAADYAKAAVPEPQSHSWGQSLRSFAVAGGPGALVDAVAQDRAQEEARAEAVRIMTTAYSAPINESAAAVPVYPQLADPTLRPPEQAPVGGPSPGAGYGGSGMPGGGGGAAGGGAAGGGTHGGGAYQPAAVSSLQGVPRGGPGGPGPIPPQHGGPRPPGGPGSGGPSGGGFGADDAAAAAAGAPFMAPLGGAGAGGDAERARRGFRSAGAGGRPGGLGGLGGRAGGGAGSGAGFGPRGPGSSAASAAEGGRMGAGPGGGAGVAGGAAGRGGAGGVPLAGAGAGRGQGGEDDEHRRPSYLVDTDDIFGDGRKVAPPVIGEDPPEHYR